MGIKDKWTEYSIKNVMGFQRIGDSFEYQSKQYNLETPVEQTIATSNSDSTYCFKPAEPPKHIEGSMKETNYEKWEIQHFMEAAGLKELLLNIWVNTNEALRRRRNRYDNYG